MLELFRSSKVLRFMYYISWIAAITLALVWKSPDLISAIALL